MTNKTTGSVMHCNNTFAVILRIVRFC